MAVSSAAQTSHLRDGDDEVGAPVSSERRPGRLEVRDQVLALDEDGDGSRRHRLAPLQRCASRSRPGRCSRGRECRRQAVPGNFRARVMFTVVVDVVRPDGQPAKKPRRPAARKARVGVRRGMLREAANLLEQLGHRDVRHEPEQRHVQRGDGPERIRARDGAGEHHVLECQLGVRARPGEPQRFPSDRLAQVANGHDDAVPGQHVAGELPRQRAGGEGTERPRLPAVQQHAFGIARCSEMTMMAEVERAVEVDRQQQWNADDRVHDEVVHPPAARDEAVDAVMIEDEDRMLSRGDEERGKDNDRSVPPANRHRDGGNDERPLDEERRNARKMERGPG